MKKYNVLVFPCGSEIGLEIFRSLSFSIHINLFGASSVDDHGKFVYRNYINEVPYPTDTNFVEKINDIVDKYNIDFIFPAHDSVVLKLAEESSKGNLHCQVITSPLETCEIARSKLKTYRFFQDILPVPKIYPESQLTEEDFPIFLKPEVGQGSKGTYLAREIEDVRFYIRKDPTLLLLEYLPGKEYTIDCFTNKTGDLLFCEGRERRRVLNGISVNSSSVKDDRFQQLATLISQHLTFRGAWFFQVKEDSEGELVLMEIAPRIAGTMGLDRAKGVNLALLSVFDRDGLSVEIVENSYDMVIDRALENRYSHNISYRHVYIDFDDLVIFNGKVNTLVVSFLYQCLNQGIEIHLLTRHDGNLGDILERLRLADIFDDVIHISRDDEKYFYVKHKDAIFIDDSYSERKKIHEMCGIPVFDAHMLESLIDSHG